MRKIIAAIAILIFMAGLALAEESKNGAAASADKTAEALKGLSVGVKGYFEYRSGEGADSPGSGLDRNTFKTTRAYLDVKKKLSDSLLVRWTSDYETGANDGSRMFMKYLYMEHKLPLNAALTLGIIPAPYIGYYEEAWPFRMRGKVPQEYFKVLDASADMGVQVGGKLKIAGSDMVLYALGVFNNEHYRSSDENKDKAIEGRLSIRPLAFTGKDALKGLELTYFAIRGKDGLQNSVDSDNYGDHVNNTLLATYSFAGLSLGYEYYTATRVGGTMVANDTIVNESIDGKNPGVKNKLFFDNVKGQTVFAHCRLPGFLKPVRVFGEYATLKDIRVGKKDNPKDGGIKSTLYGASYDIYKDKVVIVVDYNNVEYDDIGTAAGDKILQAVMQIAY